MMTRFLVITLGFLASTILCAAETGSQIAWTTETLKLVKSGNVEKGKSLSEPCKACHGPRGEGMPAEATDGDKIPAIPALAGQNPFYLYKQLRDYFNGDRTHPSMTSIAQGLSEQDAADVAAWFASMTLTKSTKKAKDNHEAEKMVKEGDGKRIIPPCFVCHGAEGQGEKIDLPSLAGQEADYFERTLMQYRSGERHNDIYSRMRLIAKQLTETEIKALSAYYQGLQQ